MKLRARAGRRSSRACRSRARAARAPAHAPRGRTDSRCRSARRATSGPTRRRSRSPAGARPPARRRVPARRRGARERRPRPGRRSPPRRRVFQETCEAGHEPGAVAHRGGQLAQRSHPDPDAQPLAHGGQRGEHAGVLLVARDDLVAGAQVERGEHGVHAVGGGARERHLGRVAAEQPGHPRAQDSKPLDQPLEQLLSGAAVERLALERGPRRLGRRAGTGPLVPAFRYALRSKTGNSTSKLVHASGY